MEQRFRVGKAHLVLSRGDITREEIEAIANAANSGLLGGGGVDGAIHDAAGPELLDACRRVKLTLPGGRLPVGRVAITPGFDLKAQHVLHCVGPRYSATGDEAPRLLASCYSDALRLCREHGIRAIAFPSISTGIFGYPVSEAAPVALGAVRASLEKHELPKLVKFVLFDDVTFRAYAEAAARLFGPPAALS
jgi:O-acetyl-ADP-ribose deacetylase (regulator of RNase III)